MISGGKVTSLNNLHPEKADFLMIFNEDGKTILSRLSQFLKDDFPIDVIDEENSKYFKLTQFLKARSPASPELNSQDSYITCHFI